MGVAESADVKEHLHPLKAPPKQTNPTQPNVFILIITIKNGNESFRSENIHLDFWRETQTPPRHAYPTLKLFPIFYSTRTSRKFLFHMNSSKMPWNYGRILFSHFIMQKIHVDNKR
jgi:hypothetical protein